MGSDVEMFIKVPKIALNFALTLQYIIFRGDL